MKLSSNIEPVLVLLFAVLFVLDWFDRGAGLLRTAPLACRACRTAFFSRSTVLRWTAWNAVRAAVNSSTNRSHCILRCRSLQLAKSFSWLVVSVISCCVYDRIW
uniref:Putative secreted peptide n=1 Tax=Anopheles braziliensis TaxID=58242 RepID=A0A2M3ZR07_9DIPT